MYMYSYKLSPRQATIRAKVIDSSKLLVQVTFQSLIEVEQKPHYRNPKKSVFSHKKTQCSQVKQTTKPNKRNVSIIS